MYLELGARVVTSDGAQVGTIDKLILDPSNGDLKSAVVRKGVILPKDVEIPIEALEPTADGVRLQYTRKELDHLPRFVEADYSPPPDGFPLPYSYPGGALLWPVGYPWVSPEPAAPPSSPLPSEYDEILRDRDVENAVIDRGSNVMSRDGRKVGEVESITLDTTTGHPTRFVIRKGLLFTEDLELPVSTIASVDDGVVYLNLDREQALEFARPAGRD